MYIRTTLGLPSNEQAWSNEHPCSLPVQEGIQQHLVIDEGTELVGIHSIILQFTKCINIFPTGVLQQRWLKN